MLFQDPHDFSATRWQKCKAFKQATQEMSSGWGRLFVLIHAGLSWQVLASQQSSFFSSESRIRKLCSETRRGMLLRSCTCSLSCGRARSPFTECNADCYTLLPKPWKRDVRMSYWKNFLYPQKPMNTILAERV